MDSQSLRSIIKSGRDQMRKDDNLSTDVDRLPQFSWILFLKCFDDFENKRKALNKNFTETIPKGLRWQDWASEVGEKGNKKKVLTGPDLIKFVNDELFVKLSSLVGRKGSEQRDIIASIFKELNNRFVSGYVLRKVINHVDKISFISTDDIHTIAQMYETMLIEMRDAAGSNGEFYTPRPVIRFIVNQIKPNLAKNERVLDPACGTGGFLIESLEFMEKQVKSKADNQKRLTKTLFGIEKKPMPYLLGMMNMLLHQLESPNIVRTNTLGRPFREITENDQYEIIMTNPPFGGEEEEGLSSNLPVGMQTSDTALSFLLYIMYTLKKNGRCGIILPNGPLFAGGVAAKIKKKLIEEFNLHTIIRMPNSVFSPYTGIATNILFFENKGTTKEIKYYQMKIREGIKAYSKTKPMCIEDFAEIEQWSKKKEDNSNSWTVNVKDIKEYNLDIKNPNDKEEIIELDPHKLIENILKDEEKTLQLLNEVKDLIKKEIPK